MLSRLTILLLSFAVLLPGWTDKGHRIAPELALKLLPADVPVLRVYASAVIDAGPEPDRWRAGLPPIKDAQEPDHFINLEMTSFLAAFPPTRHRFIEEVYAESERSGSRLRPETVGYQPYIVAEIFERLRLAFGEYNRLRLLGRPSREVQRRIAFYAGWLSHYVADGAQPLHATIHYDGWVGPNPEGFSSERGLHNKFEGAFVEQNISPADVVAVAPQPVAIRDLAADYLAYLRQSLSLVRRLYELDKAGGFDGAGTAEGRRFVAERLAAGRDMLAAVWSAAFQQGAWLGCIPYGEAVAHAGQAGCVTGTLVSAHELPTTRAPAPLALSFCPEGGACPLEIVIPGNARARFPRPSALQGKARKFIGLVTVRDARASMWLSDPAAIR